MKEWGYCLSPQAFLSFHYKCMQVYCNYSATTLEHPYPDQNADILLNKTKQQQKTRLF